MGWHPHLILRAGTGLRLNVEANREGSLIGRLKVFGFSTDNGSEVVYPKGRNEPSHWTCRPPGPSAPQGRFVTAPAGGGLCSSHGDTSCQVHSADPGLVHGCRICSLPQGSGTPGGGKNGFRRTDPEGSSRSPSSWRWPHHRYLGVIASIRQEHDDNSKPIIA